jgi:hypothetical protein
LLGCGEIFDCSFTQIDLLDCFPVLRFQVDNDLPYALTHRSSNFWYIGFWHLGRECFMRLCSCRSPAVVIGHGVSQNAIKPSHRTLAIANFGTAFNCFELRGLKDIFCRNGIFYSG